MSGREPRAVILIRESNEQLAAGWSPDQYIAQCRRKAAELGAVVIEPPLIEVGKRDEWDSPKLRAALDLAEAGGYEYLISPDTARLAGDLARLLWIKGKLRAARVELAYANLTLAPGPEGDLHENILGAFDQWERIKIVMRFQGGIAGKREKGVPIGSGKAPYGSEKVHDERGTTVGYRPKAGEIEVLRWIIHEVQRVSCADVADELNAKGIATPSGTGRWTETTVYKLVTNRFYVGSYLHGRRKQEPRRRADGRRWWKRIVNDAEHVTETPIPALVDPSEVAAARAALASRRQLRRPRIADEDDPFALRGRLVCRYCDGALSTAGRGPKRYYLCLRAYPRGSDVPRSERCPLPHVPAEAIERYAWDGLATLLADDAVFEGELKRAADGGEAVERHAEQVTDVAARIARLSKRIANGADQLRDFERGSETYQRLLEGQQADERQKHVLEVSLEGLERSRPVVLSEDGVTQARRLRAGLLAGLAEAGEAALHQRAIYAMLGTRGKVGLDPGGVRLGKYTWSVGWLEPDQSMDSLPHAWKSGNLFILTPDTLRILVRAA